MNVRQRTTLVLFQYFIEHKSIFKFVLFILFKMKLQLLSLFTIDYDLHFSTGSQSIQTLRVKSTFCFSKYENETSTKL